MHICTYIHMSNSSIDCILVATEWCSISRYFPLFFLSEVLRKLYKRCMCSYGSSVDSLGSTCYGLKALGVCGCVARGSSCLEQLALPVNNRNSFIVQVVQTICHTNTMKLNPLTPVYFRR
jgi:hypothetical protein